MDIDKMFKVSFTHQTWFWRELTTLFAPVAQAAGGRKQEEDARGANAGNAEADAHRRRAS